MQTRSFPPAPDGRSPAGAQIRYLLAGETGTMIHSTVPPGQVNRATIHSTVSEFWHVVSGHGQIWRRDGKLYLVEVRAYLNGAAVDGLVKDFGFSREELPEATRKLLDGGPYAGADVVEVSARTGLGLDDLRAALDRAAGATQSRPSGPFQRSQGLIVAVMPSIVVANSVFVNYVFLYGA